MVSLVADGICPGCLKLRDNILVHYNMDDVGEPLVLYKAKLLSTTTPSPTKLAATLYVVGVLLDNQRVSPDQSTSIDKFGESPCVVFDSSAFYLGNNPKALDVMAMMWKVQDHDKSSTHRSLTPVPVLLSLGAGPHFPPFIFRCIPRPNPTLQYRVPQYQCPQQQQRNHLLLFFGHCVSSIPLLNYPTSRRCRTRTLWSFPEGRRSFPGS